MDTFAERVKVLQSESERIKQYLHTLPPEALSKPSACTQWQVQDVIAHLIGVAETYANSVSRGLRRVGDRCRGVSRLGGHCGVLG